MTIEEEIHQAALALLEGSKERLVRAQYDPAKPDVAWRAAVDAGWPLTLVAEERRARPRTA